MLWLTREVRCFLVPDGEAPGPEPANTWAGWPAAAALAPYLRLRATFTGQPDSTIGYLCDIKHIDDLLQATAVPLAADLRRTRGAELTAADLLGTLWRRLPEHFGAARLVRLQLLPSPYLTYTVERDHPDMIQYTEQFEFSAAHRLHCAELNAQQNRDLFGKCNNPNGHGHNYVVDVTVAADADALRQRLGHVVKERVLDRFDHKHLNEDTVEFRTLNPTVENITRVVWDLLVGALSPHRLLAVRVYETPKTWAEVRAAE
jgi:6-pyruvoyltetrahydropterin/6-carboxytetrahydropterin synthase